MKKKMKELGKRKKEKEWKGMEEKNENEKVRC